MGKPSKELDSGDMAIIIAIVINVIYALIRIKMIVDPTFNEAIIQKKIAQLNDPQQKEAAMVLDSLVQSKSISLDTCNASKIISHNCEQELIAVRKICTDSQPLTKEDRADALHRVINAKGFLEQLKSMKIPIDTELRQIRQAEKLLYKSVNNKAV